MRDVVAEPLSARSRRVCALHFAVAAAVNVAAGLASIRFAWSENSESAVVWRAARFFDAGAVLDWGPVAFASLVAAVGVLGVVLLGIGATQSLAALYSLRGRRRRVCLFAGGIGIVTVVSLPWSAVGTILAWLGSDQFGPRAPSVRSPRTGSK